jgi:hypothetical protein
MTLSNLAMAVLLAAAFGFFGHHARRLIGYLKLAEQPAHRTDQPLRRLGVDITFGLGNK